LARPKPPPVPEQLYNRHPEWFGTISTESPAAGSRFLCEPESVPAGGTGVLVEVFREIAANYDIDALHMDYIRFPNEPRHSGRFRH
jgi:uncharacterized lipoprotein YddW (UPF0748 family)